MSKHKIFISYHHNNDDDYKKEFEDLYCDILDSCISKSVQDKDINDNLPDEKIREIIRDNYLKKSTVTIVLVGKDTWKRKHIDWEIYSSLYDGLKNKRNGLIGVLLPTYDWIHGIDSGEIFKNISKLEKTEDNKEYFPYNIPPRLYDNIQTGYAKIYSWDDFIINYEEYIHEAFERKNNYNYKTVLSRSRFKKDRKGDRWW
jgi:hypothetical protein